MGDKQQYEPDQVLWVRCFFVAKHPGGDVSVTFPTGEVITVKAEKCVDVAKLRKQVAAVEDWLDRCGVDDVHDAGPAGDQTICEPLLLSERLDAAGRMWREAQARETGFLAALAALQEANDELGLQLFEAANGLRWLTKPPLRERLAEWFYRGKTPPRRRQRFVNWLCRVRRWWRRSRGRCPDCGNRWGEMANRCSECPPF